MLDSHERIGKRLIPPLARLGSLNEVSWIDRLLPELLWIGLLNAEHGLATGARVCAEVARAAKAELEVSNKKAFLCLTSSFALFTQGQMARIREELESARVLSDLQVAVSPLCVVYPKCPLAGLTRQTAEIESATTKIRETLPLLFDRWNEAATFMQIHAVYMTFVQGRLYVSRETSFANFPAVEAYPRTEESRQIAAGCRGFTNVLVNDALNDSERFWPGYFWNRGLELEECRPMTPSDDS